MAIIWAGVLVVTRLLLLWHSANRATRALGRFLIGDCLPFPLAGRPFHRFQAGALSVTNASSPVQLDVSFLLRCQRSRVAPSRELQFYTWAEFPQTQNFGSESHTPTRQPNHQCALASNKNFYIQKRKNKQPVLWSGHWRHHVAHQFSQGGHRHGIIFHDFPVG